MQLYLLLLILFAANVSTQDIPCEYVKNEFVTPLNYINRESVGYLGTLSFDLRRTDFISILKNLKQNYGFFGQEIHREFFNIFADYMLAIGNYFGAGDDNQRYPKGFDGTLEDMIKYQLKELEMRTEDISPSYLKFLNDTLYREKERTDAELESSIPMAKTNRFIRDDMWRTWTELFKNPTGLFRWILNGVGREAGTEKLLDVNCMDGRSSTNW